MSQACAADVATTANGRARIDFNPGRRRATALARLYNWRANAQILLEHLRQHGVERPAQAAAGSVAAQNV